MVKVIVVREDPDEKMIDAALGCEGGYGWREIWAAMLAARPDSGMVAVPLAYLNGVEEIRASIESAARLMCEAGQSEAAKMIGRWHQRLFELRALLAAGSGKI